jgi:hypothetical protein
MAARCNQCGHENNPEYRFCGICGAPLLPPVPTRPPGTARTQSPLSGPSFLGLGDDRSRDLDYLLEDEPPRGHGRLYLALLLLLLSAALLAWHWQRDGYPWAGLTQKPTTASTPANAAPDSALPPTSPAPVEPPGNSVPPEAQAATGAGSGETAQAPAAESPGGGAASPNPAAAAPDQTAMAKENSNSGESAAKPGASPVPATAAPEATEAPESPAPRPAEAAPAAPTRKSAVSKPSPTTPPVSFDDRLVADGEKYLYGRGVPEDCARAQRNLQIGARNSNSKAQTLLGAMYATGHCVNRDLPTAYRWFAKALHGDPGNSRVQRDLEVLWKQMTPEERQLAMKSQ